MGEHHTSAPGWMQTRAGRLERYPANESGAVVILTLLLLMVLILPGVAAMTNSLIERQLAADDRAHKQALAAAGVAYVLHGSQILIPRYTIERLRPVPDSNVSRMQHHGPRETACFRVCARKAGPTGVLGGPLLGRSFCRITTPDRSVDDRVANDV